MSRCSPGNIPERFIVAICPLFVLLFFLVSVSCVEPELIESEQATQPEAAPSPTATPEVEAQPEDIPEPEPAPQESVSMLPPGEVGIYLATTLDSDSSLFRDMNTGPILLESSTRGIVLLNPETGEASIVATRGSPGYASNRLVPLTVSGRLFAIQEFSSGGVYYDEYDPGLGKIIGVAGRKLPHNTGQYALSGDKAFYVRRIERIGRPTESRFIEYDLSGGAVNDLGSFEVSNAGNLLVSDGLPYWATIPFTDATTIEVYRMQSSPESAPQRLAQGQVNGFEDYAGWSFQHPVVSEESIYWFAALDRGGSAEFEIWRYNLAENSGEFELFKSFALELSGVTSVPQFDADGDYFAALVEHSGGQGILLYESGEDNPRIIDVDVSPYDLEVMHRRR